MNLFKEFIAEYGVSILYSVLTAIAGYIGVAIKNIYKKYIDDKTKQSVAQTCVRAIEQIYTDLHGQEKFNKCVEAVAEMLNDRGISISEIEIQRLVESAVNEMNEKSGNLLCDIGTGVLIEDEDDNIQED